MGSIPATPHANAGQYKHAYSVCMQLLCMPVVASFTLGECVRQHACTFTKWPAIKECEVDGLMRAKLESLLSKATPQEQLW